MKQISSRQNPSYRRIREAIRAPGAEIVIEGPKQVRDAIAAGWVPLVLATVHSSAEQTLMGQGELRGRGTEQIILEPALFETLASTVTSQGTLGLFERPRAAVKDLLNRKSPLFVALDAVQDPGNAGTIVRLSAAFGADGILVLPGTADLFSPKAIRASSGAILSVPVVSLTVAELLALQLPLFAADAGGDPDALASAPGILVLGNEGNGLSPQVRSAANIIGIATTGRVESLNVAASAAILLSRIFEARRRAGA